MSSKSKSSVCICPILNSIGLIIEKTREKNTNGFEIDQDYHEDRLAVDYSIKSINGCKKLGVSRVNKITVLQVYKFYLPHIGGIEKIIQLIAEYSKNNGIDSRILACSHDRTLNTTEEIIGTIEVIRSNSLGTLFSTPISTSFFGIFKYLSQKMDIIHIHSPFPLGEISYLLLKPKRQKLVITYHADISQTRWAGFAPFYKYALMALLEKADRIIVTSPSMLKSSNMLQPFINKCQIIPLAIDLNEFDLPSQEQKNNLKKSLSIGSDKVVLFVGRLTYYKGVIYLISAMEKIDARLIIIGSGELQESLMRESARLRMQNKIHFIGHVSKDELPIYYSIADVFVLPSINGGEAFGLVQLEAMAFGIPIVNTDLSTGVTFVSLHNDTGLTVPPRDSIALANAINKILNDKELRGQFSKNCRARVKLFSLDKMLSEVAKVYKSLME